MTKEEMRRIAEYTRQYFNDTGAKRDGERARTHPRSAEHRWQHTLNVLHNAEQILAGENAGDESTDIVRVAAIMHDISKFTCPGEIHAQVSAEIATSYLIEQGFSQGFVERVARAIAEHGSCFGPLPLEQQAKLLSWEGKVVREADTLDKLGASALTDKLLMFGKKDLLGCECRRELTEGGMLQRSVFIKQYMWTETGKRLAEQRFAFFQMFVDQLADEVVEVSIL
jgi:HD superfamily phosphodiesterase